MNDKNDVWKIDNYDELNITDDFNESEKLNKSNDTCGKSGKSTRKACKNCICGRKNGNINVSACGGCYLGDDYRCETCPHRGKPPFDPPNKIKKSNENINDKKNDIITPEKLNENNGYMSNCIIS